jgi:raffinose/stachyose/melibiose transport system substrate-binding protein
MILGFENNNLSQANAATDHTRLAADNMGRFDFPVIDGAPGLHPDYLGRLNGWAVTKDAPPETEDFLMYLSSPDIQRVLAEKTLILPVARSAADGVTNALVKESADALANETWHQNFLDQDLGPNVGAVVNDMSIEIVTGQMAPEDATQQIQDAYALEN